MSRIRPIRWALPVLLCGFGGAAALALATSSPPAPKITKAPVNPTRSTSASFSFTDSQTKVSFLCALDGSGYSGCSSPKAYSKLAQGTHTFSVQARDAAGNTSSPASYSWRIDLTPPSVAIVSPANGGSYGAAGWNSGCASGPGVCGTASDLSGVASVKVSIKQNATGRYWSGTGFTLLTQTYKLATLSSSGAGWFYGLALPRPDGTYTVDVLAADKLGNSTPTGSPSVSVFTVNTTGMPFAISGSVPGALYPGRTAQSIPVTVKNPNSMTIYVTSLTVSVRSPVSACDANANFQVTQSTVSSTQPVQVPAGGTVTLSGTAAPRIEMLDTNTNQDACAGVQLTLGYSGSAHS